jgi:hypothetical protein
MTDERDNIREQLSAYFDGELSAAEMRRVEAAVEADEELRAELDQLRRVRELVGSLPPAEAPGGFVERVVGRAERDRLIRPDEPSREGGGALRWVRVLATAAVLAVAAGAGIVLMSTLLTTPPPARQAAEHEPEKVGEIARTTDEADLEDRRRDRGEAPSSEDEGAGRLVERRREEPSPAAAPGAPAEAESPEAERFLGKAGGPAGGEMAKALPAEAPDAGAVDEVLAKQPADDVDASGRRRAPPAPPHGAQPVMRGGYATLPRPADAYKDVLANARNVDLYVDDVVRGNNEVIQVLNANGIVVEPPAADDRATTTQWASNYNRSRAAFANTLAAEQVQIVAFVPKSDVPRLVSQLEQLAPAGKVDGQAVLRSRVNGTTAEAGLAYDRRQPETSPAPEEGFALYRKSAGTVGEGAERMERHEAPTETEPTSRPTTRSVEGVAVAGRLEADVPETQPAGEAVQAAQLAAQAGEQDRRDLLRQQLQRQTALHYAGQPVTTADSVPATQTRDPVAQREATTYEVAGAEVEPLLINLFDARAARRAIFARDAAEQVEQQTTVPARQAAPPVPSE